MPVVMCGYIVSGHCYGFRRNRSTIYYILGIFIFSKKGSIARVYVIYLNVTFIKEIFESVKRTELYNITSYNRKIN
jgi:hypothetical protein